MELQIDTKPLLRPAQFADAQGERASLEKKLANPLIQDKGEVARQIKRLNVTLDAQTPKAFVGAEVDAARNLEAVLREKILDGMPSQEEMRKSPPGAVEKHMAWEKRTKQFMLQWKNLQLRMNAGSEDGSVANFEKYRPVKSSLNMDNAQISGKTIFMPAPGSGSAVTFADDEIEMLRELAPGIADKLGLLTNEDRAQIKAALKPAKG